MQLVLTSLLPYNYLLFRCRGGEIGRHAGFKIRFWQQSEGSSPSPGTTWNFRKYVEDV